jgi:putative heme-binding domain-containing protein
MGEGLGGQYFHYKHLGDMKLTIPDKPDGLSYLVESVLAPNKVISPVFKSSVITTNDGKVITGLVVSETSDKLEVLQPDTKRIALNKNDVEERKLGDTSAMPHGIVKTTDELRDVLVYLLSNPTEN